MKKINIKHKLFENKPIGHVSYSTHRYYKNHIIVRLSGASLYAKKDILSDSSDKTLKELGFDKDNEPVMSSSRGYFYGVDIYKQQRQSVITKVNLNDFKTRQVHGEKCYVLEELEKEFVYVKADFINVLKDTDLHFFTVRTDRGYILLGSIDEDGELVEVAVIPAYAPNVSIEDVKEAIYSKDYDELSDYLKGVRDLLNATTDSGEDEDSILKYILNEIKNC